MLDPRSAFTVDTHELGRRAGAMKEFERTIALEEPIGTEIIAVRDEIKVQIRLESVVEGVLVTGSMNCIATGECVRCLEPVALPIAGPFQELYVYGSESRGHMAVEMEGDDDEVLQMEGDYLSLEPPIRDALVLSLPMSPLCSQDCAGLCSQCGARLADEPEHGHDDLDPRWLALKAALEERD